MREAPTVHVVEDDSGMRDALTMMLHGAGMSVRGYASAEELLEQIDNTNPGCLLVDVRLPGMDGFALHRYLAARGSEPAVVLITGHGDIPLAVAALKAGVVDFVEKPFDPSTLLESVREALWRAHETWDRREKASEISRRRSLLSPREATILNLLVEGDPNKVIAAKLGISVRTVEHHRARVMEKMEAHTLSQLIKQALALPG
jgi:two-component system response regulator FixJ